MKKTILVGSLVATVLFGAGFAFGQKQNSTTSIMKEFGTGTFETSMNGMGDEKYGAGPKKLANAYAKVVSDPEATRIVISSSIKELESNRVGSNAIQRSHIANEVTAKMAILQASQNARIIELLQRQTR